MNFRRPSTVKPWAENLVEKKEMFADLYSTFGSTLARLGPRRIDWLKSTAPGAFRASAALDHINFCCTYMAIALALQMP